MMRRPPEISEPEWEMLTSPECYYADGELSPRAAEANLRAVAARLVAQRRAGTSGAPAARTGAHTSQVVETVGRYRLTVTADRAVAVLADNRSTGPVVLRSGWSRLDPTRRGGITFDWPDGTPKYVAERAAVLVTRHFGKARGLPG